MGSNPIDISQAGASPSGRVLQSSTPSSVARNRGLVATSASPKSWGQSLLSHQLQSLNMAATTKHLKPFEPTDFRVLLLENVNESGIKSLTAQGYRVETVSHSLGEDELIERIRDVHVLGIRSKTKITKRVLDAATSLLAIGCFCIGTNQVDLDYATHRGVAVFNSPFSNSRSVAELVVGEIICLARQLTDRSQELHAGIWNKRSAGCWEVRGKTLGIVGYGHIGSQLSVLGEALGMTVIYYDVLNLMALGSARQVGSLDGLLEEADFVTLHVPELAETKNLIGAAQLAKMKEGSYLLNNARGSVVVIPDLIEALKSGKLAGAAIDVYPHEPKSNGPTFNNELNGWTSELTSLPNVILTPHIGGSTEEAQCAIGAEVASALLRYVNEGITAGAVNLPEVVLRSITIDEPNHARVIVIHRNVPGVLRQVNRILADHNVDKQMTDSRGDVAYLMADISDVQDSDVRQIALALGQLPEQIRTRALF